MLPPVRCFSCGKVVKYGVYETELKHSSNVIIAFEKAGAHRYCCKRMYTTYVNIIDKVIPYSEMNNVGDEKKSVN